MESLKVQDFLPLLPRYLRFVKNANSQNLIQIVQKIRRRVSLLKEKEMDDYNSSLWDLTTAYLQFKGKISEEEELDEGQLSNISRRSGYLTFPWVKREYSFWNLIEEFEGYDFYCWLSSYR